MDIVLNIRIGKLRELGHVNRMEYVEQHYLVTFMAQDQKADRVTAAGARY